MGAEINLPNDQREESLEALPQPQESFPASRPHSLEVDFIPDPRSALHQHHSIKPSLLHYTQGNQGTERFSNMPCVSLPEGADPEPDPAQPSGSFLTIHDDILFLFCVPKMCIPQGKERQQVPCSASFVNGLAPYLKL